MTGFGRAEFEKNGRIWCVEMRSVNNRYLDLKIKLPRGYNSLEELVRKKVSELFIRGRLEIYISVNGDFSDLQEVRVNLDLASGYMQALSELAKEFGFEKGVSFEQLTSYPEVIVREQKEEDLGQVWTLLGPVVEEALADCDSMRIREGGQLHRDLSERAEGFTRILDQIEAGLPKLLEQRERSLKERLDKLLGSVQLDPLRLAQEVAVMADKTDVTEEIVRLHSHLSQFHSFLESGGGVGRKLDFLIQEFLREVNTIASKINDAAIAHHTVDLKSELEKIREQVQNVE